MSNEKWDLRFLEMASLVSTWSKDNSTKVGCVLVRTDKSIVSVGYNGFPRGIDDTIPERSQRPDKYLYTEHAERNALYNSLLNGSSVIGCTAYSTHLTCSDCARGLIQSGIKRFVCYDPSKYPGLAERLADGMKAAKKMFNEAEVEVVYYGKV